MTEDEDSTQEIVGYRNPPPGSRFRKGESGNPKGRPPGSVSTAVECLRIGTKLDPYRETARMLLEPWIIEASLARLGEKHLTPKEQEIVLNATRTPTKVR